MLIEFTKMHGCGNDFVIIDTRFDDIQLNNDQIRLLADRNFGIGCDQLIMIEPSNQAGLFMRVYNRDGSEAQACGNATRCVAALTTSAGDVKIIETTERKLLCVVQENGLVGVSMGKINSYEEIDLGAEYKELGQAISVNVGNPHCVFIVDDAEAINLEKWGPKIETHEAFPDRTNVEFVSKLVIDDTEIFRTRVWERGAGVTLACGSGAMAIAWVLKEANLMDAENSALLQMDGGLLGATINDDDTINISGPAAYVFTGTIEL